MESEEIEEIIDDSQWWERYSELEYAWEMASGVYDPPVIK